MNIKNKKPDRQQEGALIKSSLKTFLIAGVCLLSLVAVVLAINAWFAFNNEVNATGMQIKVKDTIHIDECKIFKHNQPVTEGVDEYEIIDNLKEPNREISFNNYDAIWGQEDTALYIRILMHSDEFTAEDFGGLKVTIPCNKNAKFLTSSQTGTKYFSSIAIVNCKSYTKNQNNYTAEQWYKTLKQRYKYGGKNFYNKSTSKYQKISFNLLLKDNSLIISNENEILLYFRLDYDNTLVPKYLGQTENGLLNIDGSYTNFDDFVQDIKEIDFEIIKKATTN